MQSLLSREAKRGVVKIFELVVPILWRKYDYVCVPSGSVNDSGTKHHMMGVLAQVS